MSFKRTDEGLSNLHLFYGVDYVVYVEGGGRTIKLDELLSANIVPEVSMDSVYWKRIFDKFRSDKSYEFFPLGSKSALLEIAERIVNSTVSNVCIAMDRDYDAFKESSVLIHPNIIYTYGYSIENDIWHIKTITLLFERLCPIDRRTFDYESIILDISKNFFKGISKILLCEVLLHINHVGSILSERPDSFVVVEGNTPRFNSQRYLTGLKKLRKRGRPKLFAKNRFVFDPQRDLSGKVVECFGYQLLIGLFRRTGKRHMMSRQVANANALDKFIEYLATGSSHREYYEQKLSEI